MNSQMQHMTSSNPEAQVDTNRSLDILRQPYTLTPMSWAWVKVEDESNPIICPWQQKHANTSIITLEPLDMRRWTHFLQIAIYLPLAHILALAVEFAQLDQWEQAAFLIFPALWESCGTRKFNCPVTTLNSKTWRHSRNFKIVQRVKPENSGSPVPGL